MCQSPTPGRRLDTKRLVTLLEDWTIASQGIALYFPQNRHTPVVLRLFVDTVKAAMRA